MAAEGAAEGAADGAGGAAGEPAGAYSVKLEVFEGPLDLLLHLIRQNEVEITDIPIALVSEQYLEFLELMRELNLDVAGEYLVMAATLAWIKSRMLLPPEEGDEEDEVLDPRAELIARLLDYQRFKEAAEALSVRRLLGRDVFAAEGPGPERVPDGEREIEVGLFELLEAYRAVLTETRHTGAAHEIEVETITVRERMLQVMDALTHAESVEVGALFRQGGERPSRALVVATFLAILELARLAALHLYQGAGEAGTPEGPIRLRRTGNPVDWSERISELM
ncbi:MAG: segregation/condensation protein A [Proteobacteria bacterium]|nr:segregation/condensation protein A [Pseudomonadota bacterium]